jgi:hypothetical protein
MPMAVTAQVEGLAGMTQHIATRLTKQYGGDITFEVVAGGARGRAKNTLIAKVQAAYQRNPFYFSKSTLGHIVKAVPALFSAAAGARRGTVDFVKQIILAGVLENAGAQKNKGGGRFTPLTLAYARRKAAKWGAKPILSATGDLLGGLKVIVTKGGERA